MNFRLIFLLINMAAFSFQGYGQSYFDVGNLAYEHTLYGPGTTNEFDINRFTLQLNYAHQLKNEDYLLGFYAGEIFKFQNLEIAGDDLDLYANFLGAGYLHFWAEKKWSLLTQIRFKFNSDRFKPEIKYAQTGGWFLFSNKRSEKLSLFAGMYFNQEVDKTLIFPIGGIHWIPNEKWNLYILIPSNIRFEYILKKDSWYTGIESDWTLNSYLVHENDRINYFRKETLNTSFFIEKQLAGNFVLFAKIGNYQLNDYEAYGNNGALIPNSILDDNLLGNISFRGGIAYRIRD
ncbi:hypothetical protein E0K83_07510 [Gramella sp. BOM4]|nr:hypothetical protein [Christiangramia bathymodioli]